MLDWQTILERDGPVVWRTAYRLLGNQADTDDCFQETFLAALGYSRQTSVKHWRALLQHLATARAIDRLRDRRRRGLAEPVEDWGAFGDLGASPAQLAEDVELAEALRSALTQLPERQAEVFCLHCLEGWTYSEIAERLAMSIASVGVALFRARGRLRGLMEGHLDVSNQRGAASTGSAREVR